MQRFALSTDTLSVSLFTYATDGVKFPFLLIMQTIKSYRYCPRRVYRVGRMK